MRIYKAKGFERFARKERLTDARLRAAIASIEKGLVDADLGGGLIKQRVSRLGGGKSGGYRTIIAYQSGDFAVFLYGFAKNERANITPKELVVLQATALGWLSASAEIVARALKEGILIEVNHDAQD